MSSSTTCNMGGNAVGLNGGNGGAGTESCGTDSNFGCVI